MKQDAHAVVDYLLSREDIDLSRLVLYGQSIGGAVAIDLAASYPEGTFKALIVENTFLSIPKLVPHVLPIAEYVIWLCSERWNNYERILDIVDTKLPFLFLSSSRDELVPSSHQQELFQLAPMIAKKLVVIPGAGHNDPVNYPSYWTAVDEFLTKFKL
eukprot:Partr_v1_DN23951_c0_g1_i1_m48968 putative abhydrolase domain containing 13